MSRGFSIKTRKKELEKCSTIDFDLIIIGGGITGAGIALDAITRGFKTLLLEKSDFASGTSSKSTKLIHGGLRYLKQFEIGLVRESGRERAIVHNLAPHLVHPEKMLLPIVKHGSFSQFTASLAVSVYDYLAGVSRVDRKEIFNKEEALKLESLLDKDTLKAAIRYSEYRTDDARLSFELIRKARELGCHVFNYCKLDQLSYKEGIVNGVEAIDMTDGARFKFKSKYVVSAAGPWVDGIRNNDHSLKGKQLRLTKGVHIVFRHEDLPLKQAIYFDDFKGRMLFAIPRWGVSYVGTTDTDYAGNLDRVVCGENDLQYLIEATNNMFDGIELKASDVISSWAGLRPLISEPGKKASEVSRKDEIFESDSGLISIAGGKLTGYRKMAKRVLDLLRDKDRRLPQSNCITDTVKLSSVPFKDYREVNNMKQQIQSEFPELVQGPVMASYMVDNYGIHAGTILESARHLLTKHKDPDQALMQAELHSALENEACYRPEDFFIRRTGMLYFAPERLLKHFDFILDEYARFFSWDSVSIEKFKSEALLLLKDSLVT